MLAARIILILFLLIGIAIRGVCQDECELILTQATDEFNAGHLYGIPAMLKECLDKNQNREWRQRANLLLSETYLLLEDPLGAEQSYLNVLRANPEFITDETRDPIDLVYLSRKFTATPIFAFHAFVGPNASPVRVIHDVRIGGEAFTTEKYRMRIGGQVGVGMDFNYNDNLSASVDAGVQLTSFKHTTNSLFGEGKDILDFVDHQTWVNVPFSLKYSESEGKIRKYVYTGYSFNFLLADRADVDVKNRDSNNDTDQNSGAGSQSANELTSFDKSISNISMKQNRSGANGAFFLGGGLKYKVKLDFFYIDLRYSLGLRNIVNVRNRFDSVVDGLPFPYVDDDFRMDNLAISIGYIHPLYKPRKLKKARTKSVLRKIQRTDHENN
ncbi:MAG: hypothetical protein ABI477_08200 [Chryseolinea sp.]